MESRDSVWEIELISDPTVTHKMLHSLDPNSHYVFNVFAKTATGEGPPVTLRGATLLDGGETADAGGLLIFFHCCG